MQKCGNLSFSGYGSRDDWREIVSGGSECCRETQTEKWQLPHRHTVLRQFEEKSRFVACTPLMHDAIKAAGNRYNSENSKTVG